jgi:hypothetical protein
MPKPTKNVLDKIQEDADSLASNLSVVDKTNQYVEEAVDGYDGAKIKYVPTPNFTDCNSAGTLLPINMVSETVNNLSRLASKYGNLTEYIKDELGYNSKVGVCMAFNSEQIDAIAMIIEQLKKDRAFILGDMAGIGKGRVLAGVQRWCIKNGIIPVFLTFQSNLFSEMYKDIMDIHGLGELSGGKYVPPKPFIINNSVVDKDAIIKDASDNVVYEPESVDEIKRICRSGNLPKSFNCVWLTYSQIFASRKERGTDENIKHSFLNSIASRSVFLMDESHIAATGENTVIGEFTRGLIMQAKGAVFASATYAKYPKAFGLYVIKTALSEAQIPMDELEKAISIGGENVSEYIASAMVKEGQMIRRERGYAGCTISTVYKDENISTEVAKLAVYETFDSATENFRNLLDYVKSEAFRAGIDNAVMSVAEENRIELVDRNEWGIGVNSIGDEQYRDFLRRNNGKYVPYVNYDTIGSTAKFNFKESLFLAIKAKLTADVIIKELKTRAEYTYLDGVKHLTNRKPIVAIRSTLESVLMHLDSESEIIQNDFSEYTKVVIRNCESGRVVFKKVCPDFFNYAALSESKKRAITLSNVEYVVDSENHLEDGGLELNRLRELIFNNTTNIPLSAIDYIRERVESEIREDWDAINPDNQSTKNISKTFVFAEVTGRKKMLKKVDGGWKVEVRRKEATKSLFNAYNNGSVDVLLINSSGSTGQSAQSSIKFADQRPRIMYILQPELNINTEVQKRGRIHRTGQVNLPSYTYIVSLIPAEIRTLIALRSKLRKLDANVSANQVQSSDMVDIKDRNGDPIEDIYNKYGVEAFVTEFINLPDNDFYHDIYMREIMGNNLDIVANEETLIRFSRELDYQRSKYQEEFYDQMNQKYREVVAKHIEARDFQLELGTENFKAAIKSRAVVALGVGSSEFSKPLFLEDKYTLESRKTLSKEQVAVKVSEFCDGKRPDVWHSEFIDLFTKEYDNYIEYIIEKRMESAPDRSRYSDEELFTEKMEEFQQRTQARRDELEIKKARLSNKRKGSDLAGSGILDFFVPNKPCLIPDFTIGMDEAEDEEEEAAAKAAEESDDKKKKVAITSNKNDDDNKWRNFPARFIGYKLLPTNPNNKYSDASIELHFALLNGTPPILKLKPSKNFRALKYIIEETMTLTAAWNGLYRRTIEDWSFDPNKRYVRRFLSGNILSAIVRANSMVKTNRFSDGKRQIKNWGLIRYTNYDGSVSTGIMLNYGVDDVSEKFGNLFNSVMTTDENGNESITATSFIPITVPCINQDLLDYIKLVPAEWTSQEYVYGVSPMLRGLIKVVRPDKEDDSFELHVYTIAKKENKQSGYSVETNDKNPNKNKYFFDEAFLRILSSRLQTVRSLATKLDGTAKIDSNRMVMAGIYKFVLNNESHIQVFKRAMQYLWDKEKPNFTFSANAQDSYTVTDVEDVFDSSSKEAKIDKLFEIGEYEYLRTNSEPSSIPIDMLVSEDMGKGMYGSVIVNYPIEPRALLSYKMYPINMPSDVSVKLYLAMFDEQERARIKKEIELMSKDKSVYEIGEYVEREGQEKIPDMKYVFGSKSTSQLGIIFKTYIENGDLASIMYEVKEDVVTQVKVKKKTSVDFESAGKFLIGMLS